jgi:hypothetical protein
MKSGVCGHFENDSIFGLRTTRFHISLTRLTNFVSIFSSILGAKNEGSHFCVRKPRSAAIEALKLLRKRICFRRSYCQRASERRRDASRGAGAQARSRGCGRLQPQLNTGRPSWTTLPPTPGLPPTRSRSAGCSTSSGACCGRVTLETGRTATARCRRKDPSVRSRNSSTPAGRGQRKRRARARVSQAPE